MEPRIEFLSATKLVGKCVEMSFSDDKTFALWRSFMPRLKEIENRTSSELYSVELYAPGFFDRFNPESVFKKWAAVPVTRFECSPDGMESFIIPDGTYAVFIHKGLPVEGPKTYQYILNEWLPQSCFILDNRPHFAVMGEKYKHDQADSEEEIWIPVKKKESRGDDADRCENTINTYDKIASAYQEKFMDLDLYDDTYDEFWQKIAKPGAKILEIGCGPGNVTKYLLKKRPDLDILGVDLAPKMIELAKANNPSARFTVMDCREIDLINTKYDGILSGFCMPYLSKEDCMKLIKDCASLLNDDGILYLSTIEGAYSRSGYESGSNGIDRVYVYYYQEPQLQEMLAGNGFSSVQITRKRYPIPNDSDASHIILIAQKIRPDK